jgi:hypothetical protein
MPEAHIGEDTTVPVTWLFAVASVGGGVLMVAAGLMIWGTRLEAKSEFQESRITAIEVQQQQYLKDQSEIQRSLVRLEVLMQPRAKGAY